MKILCLQKGEACAPFGILIESDNKRNQNSLSRPTGNKRNVRIKIFRNLLVSIGAATSLLFCLMLQFFANSAQISIKGLGE